MSSDNKALYVSCLTNPLRFWDCVNQVWCFDLEYPTTYTYEQACGKPAPGVGYGGDGLADSPQWMTLAKAEALLQKEKLPAVTVKDGQVLVEEVLRGNEQLAQREDTLSDLEPLTNPWQVIVSGTEPGKANGKPHQVWVLQHIEITTLYWSEHHRCFDIFPAATRYSDDEKEDFATTRTLPGNQHFGLWLPVDTAAHAWGAGSNADIKQIVEEALQRAQKQWAKADADTLPAMELLRELALDQMHHQKAMLDLLQRQMAVLESLLKREEIGSGLTRETVVG